MQLDWINGCKCQRTPYKYLKDLYVLSFSFVSYEKELSYSEDKNRGYYGYKIIAKNDFNVGEVVPGLKRIVASCPQDIDDTPELNYSIFFKGKFSYPLQGPLSFVSHACVPNCRDKETKGKSGLAVVEEIKKIATGDEVTVFYGKEYFGKKNELCLCPHKEKHVSKDCNLLLKNVSSGSKTRSGLKRTINSSTAPNIEN